MATHDLKYHEGTAPKLRPRQNGQPAEVQRPFWYCTCSRFCGGDGVGWVCYISQPRKDGKSLGGKPDREGAERLHRRHIEDCNIPEEDY